MPTKRKRRPRFVVNDSLYRRYRVDQHGNEVPVLKRKKAGPKVPGRAIQRVLGRRKQSRDPYGFEKTSRNISAWRRLVGGEIENIADAGEKKYDDVPSVRKTYRMLGEYAWRIARAFFTDPKYRRRALQLFSQRRNAGTEYFPKSTGGGTDGNIRKHQEIYDPLSKVAAKEAAHAFIAGFLKVGTIGRGTKKRRGKYRIDQFFAPGEGWDGGPLRRKAYEQPPPKAYKPARSMEERARAKAKRLGRPSEWLEIYEEMKEAKAQKNAPKPFGRRQS
jgi:hypothetical protein